jgi:DNA-directed RNA polymerase subunit L
MSLVVETVEKEKQINGLGSNNLKLRIKGDKVNSTITSTIVRTALSLVGAYSFDFENIKITKNTTIYNNSVMTSRLMNFPIINADYKKSSVINSNVDTDKIIELEEKANNELFQIQHEAELNEDDVDKSIDLINNFHIYIEAVNTSDVIMNVTTNDPSVSYYADDKKIPSIYPRRSLIIKLKPGEEFICSAVATFNLPMVHNGHSAVSTVGMKEENDHSFIISIQSLRQISEEEIIRRCCRIIVLKLQHLLKTITNKILIIAQENKSIETFGSISIENENHTMGNVLTRAIQDNKYIESASYLIDHPEINELILKYRTQGKPFTKILEEEINNLTSLYVQISHKVK